MILFTRYFCNLTKEVRKLSTEEVKLVYFDDNSGMRQNFWRMPDGSFERADRTTKLYIKDSSTGSVRLIQG